jgi:site-specific DNA recombinase
LTTHERLKNPTTIPQEQLDAVVWQEIMRLLEDPRLLQAELDRRLHVGQTTDPLKRREEALRRDQARLTKSMERLLTGYQENLITLEELRCRTPDLRKQQRANEAAAIAGDDGCRPNP